MSADIEVIQEIAQLLLSPARLVAVFQAPSVSCNLQASYEVTVTNHCHGQICFNL